MSTCRRFTLSVPSSQAGRCRMSICQRFVTLCSIFVGRQVQNVYMPTFRNTLYVPHSYAGRCRMSTCRRFGTLCLFHIHRQVCVGCLHADVSKHSVSSSYASRCRMSTFYTYLHMKIGQCSETSAYKIQTPGNYPEESIQHTEHGESLESRILIPLTAKI